MCGKVDIDSLSHIPIVSLNDVWQEVSSSQNELDIMYDEIIKKHKDKSFPPPFRYVWSGFCWVNVVFITYILNGKAMKGNYKIMYNLSAGKFYHVVVFDEKRGCIYDPTYERNKGSAYKEFNNKKYPEVVKLHLSKGRKIVYSDLEYYLNNYRFPKTNKQNYSDIRRYRDNILKHGVVSVLS